MLLNAKREVSLRIKLALFQAVSGSLQGYGQKILSSLSAQRELCTDWLILLDPESGKGLFGDRTGQATGGLSA